MTMVIFLINGKVQSLFLKIKTDLAISVDLPKIQLFK